MFIFVRLKKCSKQKNLILQTTNNTIHLCDWRWKLTDPRRLQTCSLSNNIKLNTSELFFAARVLHTCSKRSSMFEEIFHIRRDLPCCQSTHVNKKIVYLLKILFNNSLSLSLCHSPLNDNRQHVNWSFQIYLIIFEHLCSSNWQQHQSPTPSTQFVSHIFLPNHFTALESNNATSYQMVINIYMCEYCDPWHCDCKQFNHFHKIDSSSMAKTNYCTPWGAVILPKKKSERRPIIWDNWECILWSEVVLYFSRKTLIQLAWASDLVRTVKLEEKHKYICICKWKVEICQNCEKSTPTGSCESKVENQKRSK